ncbi:hypothetical protein [Pelomonas cellulosilytica]|uniref:Lipoprotein n=1 Tax=Pelomonas cellulosilytica TaxID=2906762 RepID=A0ABS8XS33_9BURK|nr:hypothetical protein [Pelomonas sp. P8]MCE4553707.1 hypothetical protein [Pelomonas sp. P8]
MKLRRPLLPLALASAALASCAQTPMAPKAAEAAEAESVRLGRELRTLIGDASCNSDAQCRVVPVGAKACGGPAGYWAWSTQGTDGEALKALAARQAAAHRREVEASQLRSNCAVVTAPVAACVAGRCQVAPPADTRRGAP